MAGARRGTDGGASCGRGRSNIRITGFYRGCNHAKGAGNPNTGKSTVFNALMFVGSMIAMTALLTPASTLVGSIATAVIGGAPAGAIGGFLARRIGKQHSEYYENQLKHGGLLLWVRTFTLEKEALAIKIMEGASGRDVHIHQWSLR